MKKQSKETKRFCPNCNTLLLENVTMCPVCKREVKKLDVAVTKSVNLFFRLLFFVVFLAVIGIIGYLYMTNRELLISYFTGLVDFIK
jgi:preprotein translocase subunit SecY